jgi:hypothetical protein
LDLPKLLAKNSNRGVSLSSPSGRGQGEGERSDSFQPDILNDKHSASCGCCFLVGANAVHFVTAIMSIVIVLFATPTPLTFALEADGARRGL